MRVALVTTLERGGPLVHAHLLARELVREGASVRAVVATDEVAARFDEVGAAPVVAASGRSVVHACQGFDVVHSHDRRSGLRVLGAVRPPGRVRIHSLHGLPEPYLPVPDGTRPGVRHHLAYRVVEPRLLRRADLVITPSHAAARLAATLGHRADRLVVVPNGVDVGPARPVDGARLIGTIGTIAALEPVKGVDVFLRAASVLHREDDGLNFVVAGDGPELATLRGLAHELGLDDAVHFVGHVPAPDVLAQLGVLVVSSHFETSSLALLEAMAAGVPVVATRVGGIEEQAPACAVTLVAPGDPAALAAGVRATLRDPDAAAARAAVARRHVEDERSAATTARGVTAVYRRALDRRC
jgi:glycosyltransferase involved in cell wall biosynthesis